MSVERQGGNTVLVVSHKPEQLEMISRTLREADYSVVVASDEDEGFESARRTRPCLVITEEEFPGGTSQNFCRRLRAHRKLSAIPILLIDAADPQSAGTVKKPIAEAGDRLPAASSAVALIAAAVKLIERAKLDEQYRRQVEPPSGGACPPAALAEKEPAELAAHCGIIFEFNPHPMWVYDTETLAFLAVNDAAIHTYGYSREDFLGMSIRDIRPPEDVVALLDTVAKVRSGFDVAGVWRHQKKDGTMVCVEITSHMMTFAGRRAELVLASDVTERQAAEKRLSETEQALHVVEQRAVTEYKRLLNRLARLAQTFCNALNLTTIFRSVRDFAIASTPCSGIYISLYDAEHDVRTAVYVWSEGEEVDVLNLPPLPMSDSPHSRAVAINQVIIANDFQSALTDQPRVDVGFEQHAGLPLSSLTAPMVVMGRTVGAIEVQSLELAAFTQEHATAMRMAANLAAAAVENVRLLDRERARVEQQAEMEKMRSLGQLAAGVAHDFNNALAAILGRTQLLLRGATNEKQQQSLQVIETAALDAAETVRRIQTFTHYTPREQVNAVSIARLVNDAIELTKTRWMDDALARGLRYDIHFAPEFEGTDAVVVNPSEMREVLVNLIFNALDAMPQGGEIAVRESVTNHSIVVEVKDTGHGIPPGLYKHIFEPFFTTKGPRGSGLGLTISYGIIHRHSGTIEVSSQVGKGTTFTIRLPRTGFAQATTPAATRRQELSSRDVLVIEAETVVREVLVEMLRELKQRVAAVGTATEALQLLAAKRFDLMITDLSMPDMDGLTLASEARARAPQMPIMMTTGYGQSVPRDARTNRLINLIINKPFQLADLEASLWTLFAEYGAEATINAEG